MAAIRGSFEGFSASSRWKRHLIRKQILERPFSSVSWYFSGFERHWVGELGRRADRSRSSATLEKRNLGSTKTPFLNSNWFGIVLGDGNHY